MTFYQIIKAGKHIKIDTTGTNYTPSTFYLKDNKIWVDSPALGSFPHPNFTAASFNKHIKRMIIENFKIVIMEG